MGGDLPTRIGPYKVGELVGQGGLGRVYRGEQLLTRRPVALKVLASHADDSEHASALLMREFELLKRAAVVHPAFTQVYDLLTHEGRLVLAREFVEGVQLDVWQKEQSIEDIVRQYDVLARALAALHSQHIAVRDLKPSNVLIDSHGDPRIIDFGLAVALDRPDQLTANTLVGTPLYLAPEAWSGERPEERADIYALGVMLVEALSGKSPTELIDPGGSGVSIRDIAWRTLTTGPVGELEIIGRGPAASLVPVLREMLAREPMARPSAQRVAHALDAWLERANTRARASEESAVAARSLDPVELPVATPEISAAPAQLARALPALGSTVAALAALAVLTGAGWLLLTVKRPQPFAWASAFALLAAGFALLLRAWRRRQRQAVAAELAAVPIERNIRALEQRLDARAQVTQSIVVGVEELTAAFDEQDLERLLRRSLLLKLRQHDDLEPVQLMLALNYLRDGIGHKKPSLLQQITPWITLGGTGISALVAGVGLLTSSKILVFDDPPRITAIRASAAKISAGGSIDIEVSAEDPEHRQLQYTYGASAGTISGRSKLATLKVPPDIADRAIVVRVVARDPAGNEAIEESVIRVNHPPVGKLSFSSDPQLGTRTRVQAEVSDPDGDTLRYEWVAWPNIIPTGAADTVFWRLPDSSGPYEISCRVSDGTTTVVVR